MCARSSDDKPALMNEIREVVLIPALVSATYMSECGIIGETFEIIIRLVGLTSLLILIVWLFTLIVWF